MLASWTPQQVEAMREGMARWVAGMVLPVIPEVDQCVNYGAVGCTGRAEANGWCLGCWAGIAP